MVHDDMETSHYMKNFEVGHVPLRYVQFNTDKVNVCLDTYFNFDYIWMGIVEMFCYWLSSARVFSLNLIQDFQIFSDIFISCPDG